MEAVLGDEGRVRSAHGARWPDRCAVCNAPGDTRVVHVGWFTPTGALLLLGVASVLVTRRDALEFALCRVHARRRAVGRWLMLCGWGLPLIAILLLVAQPLGAGLCGFFGAPPAGFLALLVGWRLATPVRVVARSAQNVWATAGRPFVDSLPVAPPWE